MPGGVGVAVVVDDGDLGAQAVLLDVISGGEALIGVGEADLEDVVPPAGHIGGGGGGSELEVAVVEGFGGHGYAGSGGGAAVDELHAVALELVVGVDGLLGVALVILEIQGELETAQGVDFRYGDLGALLRGQAVHGGGAGQGADAANLDDAGSAGMVGRSRGVGGGGRGGAAAAAAAGQQDRPRAPAMARDKARFIFIVKPSFRLLTIISLAP